MDNIKILFKLYPKDAEYYYKKGIKYLFNKVWIIEISNKHSFCWIKLLN